MSVNKSSTLAYASINKSSTLEYANVDDLLTTVKSLTRSKRITSVKDLRFTEVGKPQSASRRGQRQAAPDRSRTGQARPCLDSSMRPDT